jgi:hypothetical protein
VPLSSLTLSALLAVCVYYVVVWILVGRDPKPGIFVAQYDPPVGLSPAMVRFLWKERFDDRVFWSGVLSLVAKGAASLNSSGQFTMVSPTGVDSITCSPEERPLLSWIKHRKKHATVSLLDPDTSYAASQMAVALRQAAVGKWLLNNRQYVLSGVVASAVAICIVASPRTTEQWEALLLGPGVAAPGVFYLAFVLMRLTDLLRAARVHISRPVLKRAILLGFMMFPCAAAIALGSVVMGSVLGVRTLFATAFLVLINLLFLHWMKAPTAAGRELLDKIEGFRHFLRSVDKFPMDRVDAPSDHPGLYERYLPYAVALEVEQDWSDRFIFLTETFHAPSELAGYHSFYLGMWNDKPVEIVLGPPKK